MIKKTGTESCHPRIWYIDTTKNNSILKKEERKRNGMFIFVSNKKGGGKNGAKYKGFVVHWFRTCSFFFFFVSFLETISEQLIWRTLIIAEKRMFNTKISLSLLECNGWFTIFFFFFLLIQWRLSNELKKEIEIRHVLIMKRSLRGNFFFQFFTIII